ncbi:regulator of chromosome condensation 1/beta-lactamase-inhibitor protein II [Halenospora varia]|nr:regulator of chromosome condensation 1/beta-lactamase-inhibitor protein II [Halenospora varia]
MARLTRNATKSPPKAATKSKAASKPTAKAASKPRGRPANPKPATAANIRDRADETGLPAPKKQKIHVAINSAPTQKLDIFVCGDGESGELGLGPKKIDGKKPVHVGRPRLNKLLDSKTVGIVQVAVGGMHCVALAHDGKIYTWGVNDNGALGRNTTWEAPTRDADAESDSDDDDDDVELNPLECTPTAIPVASFGEEKLVFVQVATGDSASFALTDGLVYGWGSFVGNNGLIGFTTAGAAEADQTKDGELKRRLQIQRTPVLIPNLKNVKSIAAGNDHVLALDDKGAVWTWGSWEQNQLGRLPVERRRFEALTPHKLGLSKIKSINSGAYHNFAIDEKEQVMSWGLNNFGQCGIPGGDEGGDAFVLKPALVKPLADYTTKHISGGNHHSIACTGDDKVFIWGRCDESQAGIPLSSLSQETILFDSRSKPRTFTTPTIIPNLTASFVAAGIDNSFAISAKGEAFSWGYSDNKRTGEGNVDGPVTEPTLLANTDVKERELTFAGCGGQFSLLAAPPSE